jgi:hypothetical protein
MQLGEKTNRRASLAYRFYLLLLKLFPAIGRRDNEKYEESYSPAYLDVQLIVFGERSRLR